MEQTLFLFNSKTQYENYEQGANDYILQCSVSGYCYTKDRLLSWTDGMHKHTLGINGDTVIIRRNYIHVILAKDTNLDRNYNVTTLK